LQNPNGPYPGRQLFLGLTAAGEPCFAYLVTGRSPQSRERKAVQKEDVIIIGPVGNAPYDPLRHYAAIKFDNGTGVLAVSNGIQTEAIYEMYRLLVNVGAPREARYIEEILNGADAEPDSYHTPRIAGVVIPAAERGQMKLIAAIKAYGKRAQSTEITVRPGMLVGISTYKGDMLKPEARDPASSLAEVEFKGTTSLELADFFYAISAATHEGNDIRVCAVGGIFRNGKWQPAIKNVL
jgi:IMP cyclohydrolase